MIEFGDNRLPDRFWQKCSVSGTGCWLWTGLLAGQGYGYYRPVTLGTRRVHRITYLALVGEIPSGLELDHLCRVRNCCNPAHLEPVTRSENSRRGIGAQVIRARTAAMTACVRGHEFTEENTARDHRGHRRCKECTRMHANEANRRKRASGQ